MADSETCTGCGKQPARSAVTIGELLMNHHFCVGCWAEKLALLKSGEIERKAEAQYEKMMRDLKAGGRCHGCMGPARRKGRLKMDDDHARRSAAKLLINMVHLVRGTEFNKHTALDALTDAAGELRKGDEGMLKLWELSKEQGAE